MPKDNRTIDMRITLRNQGKLSMVIDLGAEHRERGRFRRVGLRTITRQINSPYVSGLTPGLLAAIAEAVTAVAAGFYENEELPFG